MVDIENIVSGNIKQLRKERQMTLKDLSEKSGVSISMLGGIEKGDTNPTISILNKIAFGFKIPLAKLIEENRESYFLVKSDEKTRYLDEVDNRVSTVFPYDKDYGFQILEIQMNGNSERTSQGHNKGVVEFLIIREGSLQLQIDNRVFDLETGDAIRFDADKPHKLINHSDNEMKAVNLIYYNRL